MNQSLQLLYKNHIKDSLNVNLLIKNVHEIPKITKIVINRGLGEASQNAKKS